MRSPLSGGDKFLTKMKSWRSALHHLPTTLIKPQKTGNVLQTENNRQGLAPFYQNELDSEYIYTPGYSPRCQPHQTNIKQNGTTGIVALTNFAKPVVTKSYDLAPGGVSFLCTNERGLKCSRTPLS